MTKLRHGRIELQVPDDWLDQSTLLFVAPRPSVEPIPAPRVTSTLSVRFAFDTKKSARELIDEEVGAIALIQPALERRSAGPFESALGQGWLQEVRLALADVPVAQLGVAWVVGELGVIAAASCGARELAAERPRLEAMLKAIALPAAGG